MKASDFYLSMIIHCPALAAAAAAILEQPVSASQCERVWSRYGWVQGRLRGRLIPEKGKKLVMIHEKLVAQSKREAGHCSSQLEWDIEGQLATIDPDGEVSLETEEERESSSDTSSEEDSASDSSSDEEMHVNDVEIVHVPDSLYGVQGVGVDEPRTSKRPRVPKRPVDL